MDVLAINHKGDQLALGLEVFDEDGCGWQAVLDGGQVEGRGTERGGAKGAGGCQPGGQRRQGLVIAAKRMVPAFNRAALVGRPGLTRVGQLAQEPVQLLAQPDNLGEQGCLCRVLRVAGIGL
jgi:hypothetical protein